MNFKKEEVKYPVKWTYRVIIESKKKQIVVEEISALMQQLAIVDELKVVNHSSAGTYITYSFSKEVNSKEEMESIASTIHALDGVKVVL